MKQGEKGSANFWRGMPIAVAYDSLDVDWERILCWEEKLMMHSSTTVEVRICDEVIYIGKISCHGLEMGYLYRRVSHDGALQESLLEMKEKSDTERKLKGIGSDR
jgi:hypothetical protein